MRCAGRRELARPASHTGARASGRPWKARRVFGVHFRKGTRSRTFGDRAARHAAESPESLEEEGLAKGRPSEPDRRSPTLQITRATLQGCTRNRRVIPPGKVRKGKPGARRTSAGTRFLSSFAGSVQGNIGQTTFAGGSLGEGRSSQGGRAPAHPNRAEVDERQRTGPNRSGSKPPHSRVGPTEPGAWFVRSLPLKQGLGSSESAVRRDASHPALCGDQRARLRAVKSASEVVLVSMPPSLRAQGRTMPPAAFPRTGRCASFTTGRRSHPSEERR